MKKSPLLAYLFVVFFINVNAQAPAWQWVNSPSGTGGDIETHSVAADASGNVYSTGWYYGTDLTFGSTTLTNAGLGDIFIVKCKPDRNVSWALGIGGTGFDEPRSIAVDGSGNVYVTGIFDGPSIAFGATTLVNADSSTIDMFIAKFDSSGNVLWAKRAGGVGREFAEGVAVDYAGNIYVSGSFEGATVSFDAVTLTNIFPGVEDIYVVKYDPSGNVLWARSGNGSNLEWATCVTTDPYGNVFIAGPYNSDTLTFDGNIIINPFSSMGYEEMFIVKYDSSGNVSWVKQAAGNNYFNELYSLASDAFGNIFVTGTVTSDTVYFDSIILSNQAAGYYDMIFAKYDSAGNVLWAKKAGGYGSDYAYSVVSDASGNAYVCGYFDSDTMFFDSTNYALINQNYYSDLFMVKYDGSGNIDWVKSTGGIYQPSSFGYGQQGIAAGVSGDIYTVGCFIYDSLAFDADTLFLNGNFTNSYLARMNDAGTCSASFALFPDSTTQHLYWALNQATGVAPLSYLWSWGDGTYDNTAYPSHTYATGGFYPICLSITDSTGCTNTVCHTTQLQRMASTSEGVNSMVFVNVVASLPDGISENGELPLISVYPNPTTGQFTINDAQCTIESVEVYNVFGKKVACQQYAVGKNEMKVRVRDLDSGIYFIKVQSEKGIAIRKLIKQ